MPDRTKSTAVVPLLTAQEQIAAITVELQQIEARLASVVATINPADASLVAQHLRAGAWCVRTDLLGDAIATLSAVACMTDAAARERDAELLATIKRVAVFC